MKELDFDELDRAVNSLMTNVPKTPAAPEDKPIKTLNITPSTDNAAVASAPSRPASPASSASSTTPPRPVATSVAARRSGRFMDVMHPSAMKKSEPARTPVSRQGVTIAPSPAAESAAAKPVASTPPTSTGSLALDTSVHDATGQKNEWPDPLEFANFKHEPEEEKTNDTSVAPTVTNKPEEPAPLTSPFLPDTKVEKRPLGGPVTPDDAPVDGVQGQDDLTVNDPSDQLPATPAESVEPAMPEELQSDLVAIESGASTKDTLPSEEVPAEKPTSEADKSQTAKTEPAPPVQVESAPAPKGPASIPQQYHEEPSTGDQKNGSIYDTDTYHQPLTHPGKKKSGWLWVVWIVLILLVGAGIGAGLYFLGIV